jgi:hypothetical protein
MRRAITRWQSLVQETITPQPRHPSLVLKGKVRDLGSYQTWKETNYTFLLNVDNAQDERLGAHAKDENFGGKVQDSRLIESAGPPCQQLNAPRTAGLRSRLAFRNN